MPTLIIRGLRVSYGKAVLALRDVSLEVPSGAVVAVLGGNGAGKTTLLRAVSGVLGDYGGAVDAGSMELDRRPLTGRSAAAIVAAGIVQVPEGRRIFESLTVAENLRIGGFAVRDNERARGQVHELFPILHERRDQRAGLLSGGQQQMLAIGRALMAKPRLLLLDEPSLGLAPALVAQIGQVIAEINAYGTTVVVVEQNAAMALSIATHATVLTTGEVTLSGTAHQVRADGTVRDLYLGNGGEDFTARRRTAPSGRPRLARWSA